MTKSFHWMIIVLVLAYAAPAFAQDGETPPADPPPTTDAPADAAPADAAPTEVVPVAEPPADTSATDAAPTDTPVEGAETPAEEPAAEEPVEKEALDPNDPLYWAKLRGVYTLQKRQFQKQGRIAVSLYGGLIPNNIFERYFPVGLRVNYYILENLGVELAGSYNFAQDTGLSEQLQEESGVGAQQVLVGDSQVSHRRLSTTLD